jgi:hypothetical protein
MQPTRQETCAPDPGFVCSPLRNDLALSATLVRAKLKRIASTRGRTGKGWIGYTHIPHPVGFDTYIFPKQLFEHRRVKSRYVFVSGKEVSEAEPSDDGAG